MKFDDFDKETRDGLIRIVAATAVAYYDDPENLKAFEIYKGQKEQEKEA